MELTVRYLDDPEMALGSGIQCSEGRGFVVAVSKASFTVQFEDGHRQKYLWDAVTIKSLLVHE